MSKIQRRRAVAVLAALSLAACTFIPSGVISAAPTSSKVQSLIVTGTQGVQHMSVAVQQDVDTGADWSRHKFVADGSTNPFGSVASQISPDPVEQAVVVWAGEMYTRDRILGYENWFDNDWLGRDGAASMSTNAQYSGTAIGRAIAGYDYYVTETRTTSGPDPSTIPSDALHNKYSGVTVPSSGQLVEDQFGKIENFHWEYNNESTSLEMPASDSPWVEYHNMEEVTRTEQRPIYRLEPVYDEDGEPVYDEDGNQVMEQVFDHWDYYQVFDHWEWDERITDNWTYYVEAPVHKEGYGEVWQERGARVYVAGLGPYSKNPQSAAQAVENTDARNFNQSLKAAVRGISFIDIFDETLVHNPYYSSDGYNPNMELYYGHLYDAETYNWIFHLLWNTILQDNTPESDTPEPLDFTLYALSCSITAYANRILSPDSESSFGHVPFSGGVKNAGNAGAVAGYGDSDYGFTSYVTSQLSGTTSAITYSALSSMGADFFYYGQYGYLLQDLGLDAMGSMEIGGIERMVPGGAILVVYTLSAGVSYIFAATFDILQWVNPFRFLTQASSISAQWKDDILAAGGAQLPGGVVINGVAADILGMIGQIYDSFYAMGVGVVLPVSIVLLLASILLFWRSAEQVRKLGKRNVSGKVWAFVIRFVFICIGVPMLGALYTAMIGHISGMVITSASPVAEIVASTFVDFGSWAKNMRLAPVSYNDEQIVLEAQDTGVGTVGRATDSSYLNLRKTVSAINYQSGAADCIDMSFYADDDYENAASWTSSSLSGISGGVSSSANAIRQGSNLVTQFMMGDFYQASDFSSDTLAAFSSEHSGNIGDLETNTAPGTLYEMFDTANHVDDWTARTNTDNSSIMHNSWPNWTGFNMFGNGALTASERSSDGATVVSYTNGGTPAAADAVCPHVVTGLSTVSMYNYLSTRFDNAQMTIYSNENSGSMVSREAHYAVNIVGSGMMQVLYGLNCFAVLGVSAVLGVVYAFGLIVRSVKRAIETLMAIPFALIGVLRSIIQVILCVFAMVLEVVGTVAAYVVVTELVMIVATVLEQPMLNISSTTVTGILASVGGYTLFGMFGTKAALTLFLGGSTVVLLVFAFISIKAAPCVMRTVNSVLEFVWTRFVLCEEVARVIEKRREKQLDSLFYWPVLRVLRDVAFFKPCSVLAN